MRPALEKRLVVAFVPPDVFDAGEAEPRLNVSVVFTSVKATLAALRQAAQLANCLGAHITLIVPQVVPYPLPLSRPPVPLEWSKKRFRVMADASAVETTVQIHLCRDALKLLKSVLAPGSPVVIGGHGRWWLSRERSWARALRRAGHEVLLTRTE